MANQRAYQEVYVSNPQNERLYQVIDIDDSGGCHAILTNEPYSPADYIGGFIIYVNGTSGYIDILKNKDHYL